MNYPRVTISLLNWNGWQDTLECLESLCSVTYPNFEIIVTDNASSNESVEKIFEWIRGYAKRDIDCSVYSEDEILIKKELGQNKLRIHLLKNRENYGFSGGNNKVAKKAVEQCGAEFVLFLNNDTIVDPDFLMQLVEGMQTNEKIVAVAPLVYRYEEAPTKKIYCFGGDINAYTGFVTHRYMNQEGVELPKIDFVRFLEGSALLVKGPAFLQAGGFDEKFFAYFEDVDLSHRFLKNGHLLACISTARIWHKVSRSSQAPKKAYYLIRNLIWYMKKNGTVMEKMVFLMYLPVRLVYLLLMKSRLEIAYMHAIVQGAYEGLTG